MTTETYEAMSDRDSIVSWIHTLPEYTGPPKGRMKRKLAHLQEQLTSPLGSLEGADRDELPPTQKERHPISAGDDEYLDVTSRAGTSARDTVPLSDTSSMASGASSLRKKLILNLRLSESGVEFKSLSAEVPPVPAHRLVKTMAKVGHLVDILPHTLQSAIIEEVNARNLDDPLWARAFQSPGEIDTLPGRVPTFEEIENICRKASMCQEHNHEEPSWNYQVHLRLLESIFEEFPGRQCDQFNVMSCTTARPHRLFTPIPSPIEMIDICIYASTDQDADLRARIEEFSRVTPTQTVNHTDFVPIRVQPLLLGIETKKPGVHWDMAQLQIGLWHAAQWSFLRWAVGRKIAREQSGDETRTPQTSEQQDEKVKELAILSKLGFIPGVIVQGHEWYLVLSTYENGKTKLWTHRLFGTTQTTLDSYAIVAGIRQLTAWARDVYLPWFKANVLD